MKIKNSIILSLALLNVSLPSMASDNFNGDEKGKANYQKVYPAPAMSSQQINISLSYRLKQGFYNYLHALARYADSDPSFHIPLPTVMGQSLIPLKDSNTLFKSSRLYTVKKLSSDDEPFIRDFVLRGLYFLRTYMAPTALNLPQIPGSKQEILKLLPSVYKSKIPALQFISEQPETDDFLGYLALQGAIGSYIKYTPTHCDKNLYTIDFSSYYKFQVKDGLARLGGKAYLRYCPRTHKMVTKAIEYQGHSDVEPKLFKKTDVSPAEWNQKQRTMLAAMLTDIGVGRHFLDTHVNVASTFCAVSNECLPTDHPLRRLMQPHQNKTLFIGHYKPLVLIGNEQSYFPAFSSYNLTVLNEMIEDYCDHFDMKRLDVRDNAEHRHMLEAVKDQKVQYPALENSTALWDIIQAHVTGYIDIYYKDGENLITKDANLGKWIKNLSDHIPNQAVKKYLGKEDLQLNFTKDDLTKLITLFIYTASVEHESVANFQALLSPWQNLIATQVPADPAKQITIDIYHQYLDLLFAISAPSVKITNDFSYQAIDEAGKKSFKNFRQALLNYQAELKNKPYNPFLIYPDELEGGTSS